MVAAVLGHPPGVADADEEVGERPPGDVVGRARFEHLPVRGLVGQERVLGEDDAQRGGHEQLEPGVAEQDEPGDHAAEGGGDRENIR